MPEILQLRLVIDANIVQEELRWRLKRRRKADARTALHEALASGVLIAYAPHFLEDEIREHALRIAMETNTPLEHVLREWEQFREHLCFYTARTKANIDVSRTDPDDVAYIDTIGELAARAIYTRDRDYLRTTVPLVLIAVDSQLQRYARATSLRLGIAIGSCCSVVFGLEALTTLSRLLSRLVHAARRLPPAVQILIVGSVAVAVAHPKSRAKMLQLWQSLNRNIKPAMWEAIVISMNHFMEATAIANESHKAIHDALPPPKRRRLLDHAAAVCLSARRPLPVGEIVREIIANGYKTRSSRPEIYLLRKLRSDNRFRQTEAGWLIRPVASKPNMH
jgi:predicted nucleic acid-binding protein